MVGSRVAVGHRMAPRSALDAAQRLAESGAQGRRRRMGRYLVDDGAVLGLRRRIAQLYRRLNLLPVERALLVMAMLLFGLGIVGVVLVGTVDDIAARAGAVQGSGVVQECPDTGRTSGMRCSVRVTSPGSRVGVRTVESSGWFDSMDVGERAELVFESSGEIWVAGQGVWLNRAAAVTLGLLVAGGSVSALRAAEESADWS